MTTISSPSSTNTIWERSKTHAFGDFRWILLDTTSTPLSSPGSPTFRPVLCQGRLQMILLSLDTTSTPLGSPWSPTFRPVLCQGPLQMTLPIKTASLYQRSTRLTRHNYSQPTEGRGWNSVREACLINWKWRDVNSAPELHQSIDHIKPRAHICVLSPSIYDNITQLIRGYSSCTVSTYLLCAPPPPKKKEKKKKENNH